MDKDLVALPGLENQVKTFVVLLAHRARLDAVAKVGILARTERETGDQSTATEDIQHRELFSDAERRVVQGQPASPMTSSFAFVSAVRRASDAAIMFGLHMSP